MLICLGHRCHRALLNEFAHPNGKISESTEAERFRLKSASQKLLQRPLQDGCFKNSQLSNLGLKLE